MKDAYDCGLIIKEPLVFGVPADLPVEKAELTIGGATLEPTTYDDYTTVTVKGVTIGGFADGEFSLDCSTNGDGKISYSSSDTAVITVSEDGTAAIVGAGKATITVTLANGTNYNGANKFEIKSGDGMIDSDGSVTFPEGNSNVTVTPANGEPQDMEVKGGTEGVDISGEAPMPSTPTVLILTRINTPNKQPGRHQQAR